MTARRVRVRVMLTMKVMPKETKVRETPRHDCVVTVLVIKVAEVHLDWRFLGYCHIRTVITWCM